MRRQWTADELTESWSLRPEDKALLGNKSGATRLGFAVLLKFFQYEGRFPRQRQDVPVTIIECIAEQVGVSAEEWKHYDWEGRAIKYHRSQIRQLLGFREVTVEDGYFCPTPVCVKFVAELSG